MRVADAVGQGLAKLGAEVVFGVVGSGNFHITNALIAGGSRFVAARHEGGATVMADAWARTTGRPGLVSVHQGPGLTNAMTGIAEAAKSRTPLVVLAAEAPEVRSNFHVDVAGLAAAVGAVPARLHSPGSALADAHRAYQTALGRRTVILALPLDVQAAEWEPGPVQAAPRTYPPAPAADAVTAVAAVLRGASRPVFVAGRGARGAGPRPSARAELERLADACGALLATSAVAKGLFRGNPWDLDVSGGFASPLAAELICGADVIVGWGCSLNMWTMRHGKLIGTGTTLIQVDDDASALGAHRAVHLGVLGDVTETARAVADALGAAGEGRAGTGRGRHCGSGSLGRCAGGTSRSRTRATGSGSIRAHCPRRWMTYCPRNGPWRSTQATSWATRACTCPCPTRRGSASPRRSSRSGSGWPRPSGPRSRGRTG